MTAVMTEAPKTGEATLENLRARAGELEAKVENLRTSLADSRRRLESLTAERGSLVLPARSGKDASAQKRLYAIDEQLAVLGVDDDVFVGVAHFHQFRIREFAQFLCDALDRGQPRACLAGGVLHCVSRRESHGDGD